jgi:uncharacterized membrane protein
MVHGIGFLVWAWLSALAHQLFSGDGMDEYCHSFFYSILNIDPSFYWDKKNMLKIACLFL